MTERLPAGELERRVMDVLWSRKAPTTPRQVHEVLSDQRDLAYTTVMTTLARLWQKGLLDRTRVGRAFAYRPRATREEQVAERMRQVLAAASDRGAALGHFVESLESKERTQLRDFLGRRRR